MVTGKEFNKRLRKTIIPTEVGLKPGEKPDFQWGLCWLWAAVFHQVNGGELVSIMTPVSPGHAMVVLGGRFFDYDHPEGISFEDFKSLEVHTVAERYILHKNYAGFSRIWKDARRFSKPIDYLAEQIG